MQNQEGQTPDNGFCLNCRTKVKKSAVSVCEKCKSIVIVNEFGNYTKMTEAELQIFKAINPSTHSLLTDYISVIVDDKK